MVKLEDVFVIVQKEVEHFGVTRVTNLGVCSTEDQGIGHIQTVINGFLDSGDVYFQYSFLLQKFTLDTSLMEVVYRREMSEDEYELAGADFNSKSNRQTDMKIVHIGHSSQLK